MTETELQNALATLLESIADAREEMDGDDDEGAWADLAHEIVDEIDGVAGAETFRDAELLTSNAGVILTMADGSEFQITIVQSRSADGD